MTATLTYEEFLAEKVNFRSEVGFDVPDEWINPLLKPHQRAIVKWAVRGGRRAIFAAFGLGKSMIQLEVVRLVGLCILRDDRRRTTVRSLIVIPLGVRQEFTRDAAKLGLTVTFVRHTDDAAEPGIYLTNYESIRDGRLDPSIFDVVTLDEASVLRSFGSKTYQTFLTLFDQVPYRFVATATPAPNRYKELIHYAGFLGVMDTGQALTRFFQRDSTKANNLTLYPHKEQEFYLWLATWAVFLQLPSDLGFDDDGYVLPPIEIRHHVVSVDHTSAAVDPDGQAHLFRGGPLGVSDAAREKRDTLPARIAAMADIVDAEPDDHFILWHTLEDERRAIKTALPDAIEVYGTLDLDVREQRVIDFSEGRSRLLATKPELSGSGCNFQRHCHRAVFVGVDFKFNDWIQAIYRIQRFQQEHPVVIDLVYAESETEVVRVLLQKWAQYKELTARMTQVIKEHGLNGLSVADALTRSIGIERIEISGDGWTVANNDCVPETRDHMATDSIDMIITSIPFSNHYEYTPSYNDFGHTDNNDHFWAQMDYLTPELVRVLRPGRIYACHVKDRILFGSVTGTGLPTVSPFHAEAIAHGRKHGLDYMGMRTIVTDVVRENNQTYRLGWTEMTKDATKMGSGSPEYVLLFHKPQTDRTRGYADTPVSKDKADYTRARWQVDAHAFWRSSGNRHLTPDELATLPVDQASRLFTDQSLNEIYDYEAHVRIGEALDARGALPSKFFSLAPGSWHREVWHDVNRMLTLNTEQSQRALTQHVCPLQFDIVDRLIRLYSNPGDTIYDPFGGLFTVTARALLLGRHARSVELNASYFCDGVKYAQAAERKANMPALFDLDALEAS
jgi:hypothetical protein